MLGVLIQSTQYITSNVTASSSPTGNAVSMAFVGPYVDTQAATVATVTSGTTFFTGSWVGATPNTTNQWTAQCLVGPNSSNITFSSGVYVVFVKIAGSPESPVLRSGYLEAS